MIDFELDRYNNHKESLVRITKKSYDMDFMLNEVDIDFANKITGELENEKTNQFLKAISYRIESILFHYNLLYNINPDIVEQIEDYNNPFTQEEISIRQNCLFDSIVFHTASLFDYFSCFIWHIIENKETANKCLWTSLSKSARNHQNLTNSKLGELIDLYDREWICKLFDYRAELIHYKDDWANEIFDSEKQLIVVLSPISILKYFKFHKKVELQNKVLTINQISLWLVETSFDICIKITEGIKEYIDLNRVRNDDVISFRNSNNPDDFNEIIDKLKNKNNT
ncbi:MAG TPA: hypothetical protein VMV56_01005 [Williamwhitmania sp.]|nr:hypothetical protein [Williamwhitmania sp.]